MSFIFSDILFFHIIKRMGKDSNEVMKQPLNIFLPLAFSL